MRSKFPRIFVFSLPKRKKNTFFLHVKTKFIPKKKCPAILVMNNVYSRKAEIFEKSKRESNLFFLFFRLCLSLHPKIREMDKWWREFVFASATIGSFFLCFCVGVLETIKDWSALIIIGIMGSFGSETNSKEKK